MAFWVVAFPCRVAEPGEWRVRLSWGGGPPQRWQGTIGVSAGALSAPTPLGIEADASSTLALVDGEIRIQSQASRSYDGLDLTVNGPEDAVLRVRLGRGEADEPPPAALELPLAALTDAPEAHNLDPAPNKLLAQRAPGDRLRVHFERPHLVFEAGEKFSLELEPWRLAAPGTKVEFDLALVAQGSRTAIWSNAVEQTVLEDGRLNPIPLALTLPETEGVYDLVLEASTRRLPTRFALKQRLARRVVQVMVVGQLPAPPTPTAAWETIVEFDPARPNWRERIAGLKLLPPALRRGQIDSGDVAHWPHPLGELTQLGGEAFDSPTSWAAYTIPVTRVGRPHVLEVEYPSDVPQALGISVVEPNAAGAMTPLGLDSGVWIPDEAAGGEARLERHQLVFWPRTRSPLVLLTNLRTGRRAVFGKLRVLAGPDSLPPLPAVEPLPGGLRGRFWGGYMDRPLFAKNFLAEESLDEGSGRSLDDWRTFHQGALRLVEHLQHTGQDGLMLTVLSDGGTLFPTDRLRSTLRYDTGPFFESGQDPVRKDVLELALRMFDRAGLKLIPALELATPLVELENLRQAGGSEASGLEWIGADGASWLARNPARRGLAPCYNVLDPRVQRAVLELVRELVARYEAHPSLAGFALKLDADGYAALRGPEWGLDDATIARFAADAKLVVPGEGPGRFQQRARFLEEPAHRAAWLAWRSDQLTAFYAALARVVAEGSSRRLYLAPTTLLRHPSVERELRPALPRKSSLEAALAQVGFDPARIGALPQVTLLRPQTIGLASATVPGEWNHLPDIDRELAPAAGGSLFFHPPEETRLPSFDERSPFKSAYAQLVSQVSASGSGNRARFAHALATQDSGEWFDGGWLLPLGQEASLAELAHVYRRLPAQPFRTLEGDAQPVVVRTLEASGRTYAYLVNDSAWSVTVSLRVAGPKNCRLVSLHPDRPLALSADAGGGQVWKVELGSHDLVAGWFDAAGVVLREPRIEIPGEVRVELERKIKSLGDRVAVLQNPPALELLENSGFEAEAGEGRIPGWAVNLRSGVAATLDTPQAHAGMRAARLSSGGPIASLASAPTTPPATGRLSISVWLRVADAERQPPLRLALDGKLDGRDYYRFASLGAGPNAPRLSAEWQQYVFQINDLPLSGLSQVRVRFDLMGAGEVWIDDVALFGLLFREAEQVELKKMLFLANRRLQGGQLSDCQRMLSGYWPQFLLEHVPLTETSRPPQAAEAEAGPLPPARTAERPGAFDGLRRLLPGWK